VRHKTVRHRHTELGTGFIPMMSSHFVRAVGGLECYCCRGAREEYLCTGNNSEGVADGLAATGKVITADAPS